MKKILTRILIVVFALSLITATPPMLENTVQNPVQAAVVVKESSTIEGNMVPALNSTRWETWYPREEIAPRFLHGASDGKRILRISSKSFDNFGKWTCSVPGIKAGDTYKFSVEYLPEKIANESASITAMLSWTGSGGRIKGRDYVDGNYTAKDGWKGLTRTIDAPSGASGVVVELWLKCTVNGTVSFRNVALVTSDAIEHTLVKVATTFVNARKGSLTANLNAMLDVIDKAGHDDPDIICLSEFVRERGVTKPYQDIADTIPGDTTKAIGEKAKKYGTYIAFSMCERDGKAVYNTAVLIGKDGGIKGKYRKVHLPLDELEGGLTPGMNYPVFQTEFGKVGMMICWDQWFPEAARALRASGADLILVPTIGDAPTQALARAVENGVYLIISGQNNGSSSKILSPQGETLTEVTSTEGSGGYASATIDLADRYYDVEYWLNGSAQGEPRVIYMEERRPDTYKNLFSK